MIHPIYFHYILVSLKHNTSRADAGYLLTPHVSYLAEGLLYAVCPVYLKRCTSHAGL